MKIAVVLPHGSRFSVTARNSIEQVVGEYARLSRFRPSLRVVCDAGAEYTGDIGVIHIKPTSDRTERTRRVIAALRVWQPDLVEIHEQGAPARMIASAFRNCVTCWYRHSVPIPPMGRLRRFRHLLRQLPFDAHIFVSEAARQSFVNGFPRLQARSHIIRNSIELSAWFAEPRGRSPVVVYVGRPAPEKGFAELCDGLDMVLAAHSNWRATFVLSEWNSYGTWAREVLAPLESYGERFQYHTDQGLELVRRILQDAAIAVAPSIRTEAFPLAVLEAHAAGAAVISSGAGGLGEASGAHALYLDRVSARTIAKAIDELIRDPDRLEALAEGGQQFVAGNHGIERRAVELDDLREQLLAAKRKMPEPRPKIGDLGVGTMGQ